MNMNTLGKKIGYIVGSASLISGSSQFINECLFQYADSQVITGENPNYKPTYERVKKIGIVTIKAFLFIYE